MARLKPPSSQVMTPRVLNTELRRWVTQAIPLQCTSGRRRTSWKRAIPGIPMQGAIPTTFPPSPPTSQAAPFPADLENFMTFQLQGSRISNIKRINMYKKGSQVSDLKIIKMYKKRFPDISAHLNGWQEWDHYHPQLRTDSEESPALLENHQPSLQLKSSPELQITSALSRPSPLPVTPTFPRFTSNAGEYFDY